MITLGIDTTAVSASAALVKDGVLLSEFYTNIGLQHSRTLMPMVESLLRCCNIKPEEIDRFGVNAGPGSFTGVRIGVSAVKGMALPNHTPCVALSTLECLAHNLPESPYLLCPAMDARCNQVYNGLFQWENGTMKRLCEDRAITVDGLLEELSRQDKPVVFLGDGAHLCFNALPEQHDHILAPAHLLYQRASQVALLAEAATQTVAPQSLAVSYLRPPQAVRARMEKQ